MKVKKLGRPKAFQEKTHRLTLVLPESLRLALAKLAKERKDKPHLNHEIYEALYEHVRRKTQL